MITAKNQGYLFQEGEWHLSPAYDITFASAEQLPERGMAVCGERHTAGRAELKLLAEREGLDRVQAANVVEVVTTAIASWREFAERAGISSTLTRAVAGNLGH